MAPRTRDRL